MDFENVLYEDNKVVLEKVMNFNIKQILECGQCFRWEKINDEDYIIIAYGRVIEVIQNGDQVTILNSNEEDFKNIFINLGFS